MSITARRIDLQKARAELREARNALDDEIYSTRLRVSQDEELSLALLLFAIRTLYGLPTSGKQRQKFQDVVESLQ